jgi:hypothetical protein
METVTGGHMGEDALVDLLDGVASAEARAHAASCLHCRARLDQAVSGLDLAQSADIPEPSPLFWQSFRRQVDQRIEAGDPSTAWRGHAALPWLAAAAALIVAVAVLLPHAPAPAPVGAPSAAVLPAWSALPPADEDAGLDLLAAVVPGNSGLGPLAECQGLGECMTEAAGLSEEESATLTDALQRELGRQS